MGRYNKYINKHDWLGYPAGKLDTVVFVYRYEKWKVIPYTYVKNHTIYDNNVVVITDKGNTFVIDKENIKDISKGVDGLSTRLYECYICNLDDTMKYFSDCIYLKTDIDFDKDIKTKKFVHGVIFISKDIDQNGESKTKTILLIGDFNKTMGWFRKHSSAASEKTSVIVPTDEKEWIKKYSKSVIIKL